MSPLRASQLRVRRRVDDLLEGRVGLPVDVEAVAKGIGVEVRALDIAEDLSGILYWEGDRRIIVVNASHESARRRVSIARELGFLTLHRRLDVRIDHGLRLALDDPFAGTTETIEDVEASLFALHLLMPQAALEAAGVQELMDFNDQPLISACAARLCVPPPILVVRLLTLHS